MHSYWWMHPEDPWGLMIESFLAGVPVPGSYSVSLSLEAASALAPIGNLTLSPAVTLAAIGAFTDSGGVTFVQAALFSLTAQAAKIETGQLVVQGAEILGVVAEMIQEGTIVLPGSIALDGSAGIISQGTVAAAATVVLQAIAEILHASSLGPIEKFLNLDASGGIALSSVGQFVNTLNLTAEARKELVATIVMAASYVLQATSEIAQRGGFERTENITLDAQAQLSLLFEYIGRIIRNPSTVSATGRFGTEKKKGREIADGATGPATVARGEDLSSGPFADKKKNEPR